MATDNLGELLVKLSADIRDLKSGLQAGRGELSSFKSQAESLGASIKKTLAFAGIATGIWEMASALKEFAKNAAMTGARVESLEIGMNLIGKNVGMSADSLALLTKELKQAGITTEESMKAINSAMVSGIDLNQLTTLATRARDVAAVAGKNTSEVLTTIMHALVSRQMEMIRNLNVPMQNYEDVVKRISGKLGIDKDQIDRVTMVNELAKAFMESSKGLDGAAKAMDAAIGKQMNSLDRMKKEAYESLWAFFQPIMESGVQALAGWWQGLAKFAADNKKSLSEIGTVIGEFLKGKLEILASVLKTVAQNADMVAMAFKAWGVYVLVGWVSKLAVALGLVGTAAAAASVEVTVLSGRLAAIKAMIATPWGLIITISVIGLAAAYAAINEVRNAAQIKAIRTGDIDTTGKGQGAFGNVPLSGREMTDAETKNLQAVIADQETSKKYKGIIGGALGGQGEPVATSTSTETPQQKLIREAQGTLGQQKQKAASDIIPKTEKGGGGGGGSGKGENDKLLSEYMRMLETKRKAELADAQESFDILRATNDKKRSELEKSLAEGLIDGQTYYQRLQELQQGEMFASLAMIQQKRQAQEQAYREAYASIGEKEMSAEAIALARQKLEIQNKTELAKLNAEEVKIKLEGEKKLTEELKRQVDIRQQYQQKTEDLNIETAQLLGAISEQEATLQKLYLDWQRAKQDAIKAGAPDEYVTALGQNYEAKKLDANQTLKTFGSNFMSSVQDFGNALFEGSKTVAEALDAFGKNILQSTFKLFFEDVGKAVSQGIKSMVAEIANSMQSSAGGGGLSSFFSGVVSWFKGLFGGSGDVAPSGWAHGGAFMDGIRQSFATGGIVNRPTLFAMASGAGLMGEAGPEAILPLTRIGGDLGVKAIGASGPAKVTVVNNLGVEAKPTVQQDSNGDLMITLDKTMADVYARGGKFKNMINADRNRGF